jgi:ParB family chromosome partitioning protein
VNTPEPIVTLSLDRIVVGQRLRPVDDDYVTMLAASMAESGQHTPIHVGPADADGRHPLIAGAHRVAAAPRAGLSALQATVFRGDDLAAQLLEIDENLMRRGLSELDRAVFLARRKEIYVAMHPETGMGKRGGKKPDKLSGFPGADAFSEQTAQKLGLSRRSIDRAIARSRIEPNLRQVLALSRWANHGATLDALLKADGPLRHRLVQALTRDEKPAKSIAHALAEVRGPRNTPDPADEQFLVLKARWEKAAPKARRRFLAYLTEMGIRIAPEALEDA